MQVLGRLKPSMTFPKAQAGLQPWFKAMLEEDTRRAGFPTITAERRRQFLNSSITLSPAPRGHSGLRRRLLQPLWVLFAVTAVLLDLACLNVAGLFTAGIGIGLPFVWALRRLRGGVGDSAMGLFQLPPVKNALRRRMSTRCGFPLEPRWPSSSRLCKGAGRQGARSTTRRMFFK